MDPTDAFSPPDPLAVMRYAMEDLRSLEAGDRWFSRLIVTPELAQELTRGLEYSSPLADPTVGSYGGLPLSVLARGLAPSPSWEALVMGVVPVSLGWAVWAEDADHPEVRPGPLGQWTVKAWAEAAVRPPRLQAGDFPSAGEGPANPGECDQVRPSVGPWMTVRCRLPANGHARHEGSDGSSWWQDAVREDADEEVVRRAVTADDEVVRRAVAEAAVERRARRVRLAEFAAAGAGAVAAAGVMLVVVVRAVRSR